RVTVAPAAVRTTAVPSTPFRDALAGTASAAIRGAQAAAQALPGGEALSAALTGSGPASVVPLTEPLSHGGAGAGGVQGALDQQADNALYYLKLQQQVQDENRSYTTLSNVMKARHDTVKGAIGNLR